MTRTYSKEQLDAMIAGGLTGPEGPPGADGADGVDGADGAPGVPAYTTTSAGFTQPASGANVTVSVGDTSWMGPGQELYVATGGYYAVSSITNATTVVLTNSGYPGSASPGATINSGSKVSPGGVQGPSGASGAYSTIQEDGTPLTQRTTLNFGSNITAADNSGASKTDVSVPSASDTTPGVVELATDAETQTGTDTARAVTPANLTARSATETRTGVVELATDAETQTGSDTARAITPANLSSRSATETRTGVAEIATQAETDTGTDDARLLTPLKFNSSAQLKARTTFGDVFSDFVVSGFNPSLPGATLTMTTPSGVAYIGGSKVSIAADTSRAYTASRDTYLDVNASGTYTAVAVTNGAAEPAVTSNSLRLLKVVTSGTQVTAITQRNQSTSNTRMFAYGAFYGQFSGTVTASDQVDREVALNSITFDNSNAWDSVNTRYTCPKSGVYLVKVAVQTGAAPTANSFVFAKLRKNGVAYLASNNPIVPSGFVASASDTFIAIAEANDYFELYGNGYNGGAGTLNITTGQMGIAFMGGMKNVPGP